MRCLPSECFRSEFVHSNEFCDSSEEGIVSDLFQTITHAQEQSYS